MAIRVEAGARQVHSAVEVGEPRCCRLALVPRPLPSRWDFDHSQLWCYTRCKAPAPRSSCLWPCGGTVRGGRSVPGAFRVMAK